MSVKSHSIHHVFSKPYPFEIFLPQGPGPFPAIFITPLLGRIAVLEDLYFERKFARFFAENGLASIVIGRPIFEYASSRGLEQIQSYIEESLERNRGVLKHVLQESWIDKRKLGSFGMSFGSIINTLWAASEKQLRVNVFAMGGGNLPEIFMKSQDPLMKSYRNAAQTHSGLSLAALKNNLKSIFQPDPLSVAPSIAREQTLLILGRWDRVVPIQHGRELQAAMNHPETILLPAGHYLSLLAFPFIRHSVLKFFKIKFQSLQS